MFALRRAEAATDSDHLLTGRERGFPVLMQAKIRAANLADLGALIDLENRSFSTDRISPLSFRRLMASRSASVLVAAAGALVAGYAIILRRSGSRVARLYSLAVDPQFRGLGRELLAAAERSAAAGGCRLMRLEVRDDNLRAINLYQRADYRQFGNKPGSYADGAAALRFEKPIYAAQNAAAARLAGTAAA
jgi:[ribosomal protein S18]-alanine N-acetyltransferase